MQVHLSNSKVYRQLSAARLRELIRARGVACIQIVYCRFDGVMSATLLASRSNLDTRRIHLPRRLRRETRRLFELRMAAIHRRRWSVAGS